jgi:DNA modification methylase
MSAELAEVLSGARQWCVIHAPNEAVLPTLPLGVIDALVTDPPYGIGEARGKNASRGNAAVAKDYGVAEWDDAPPSPEVLDLCRRVTTHQIIFGGNYFVLPPSSCWLVWDKLNGDNDFADCELAWTNLKKAVRRIAYRWNGMIRQNGEERGEHPTQKPVGVMLWALDRLPSEDRLILDPWCGSGTTGVAAIRQGRRFIGIEREARYAEVARERLEAESRGLDLSDYRAGQASLFGGEP